MRERGSGARYSERDDCTTPAKRHGSRWVRGRYIPVIPKDGALVKSLYPAIVALAFVIGLSRVVLGVHFPRDVLIGQLIAILTAVPFIVG